MTARATIKCVTCGRPIEGAAVTRYDGGWIHVVTRSEKCASTPAWTTTAVEDQRPLEELDGGDGLLVLVALGVGEPEKKWGPDRISGYLATKGISVSPATVHRELKRRGINRVRNIDAPTGESMRKVIRYEHGTPGDMLHIDVKKVGMIPEGGGWWAHGRGTEEAKKSRRKGNVRRGYTYPTDGLDVVAQLVARDVRRPHRP